MIDLFVQLLLSLNKLLFNNLGLTIIVIGILSRLVFYPVLASQLRYSKALREMKPKLDEIKKRYGNDMRRVSSEQSRLFREAGVSPVAGAISCLGMIFQFAIFILLYQCLTKVIASGVETSFFFWDLAKPDVFNIQGVPVPIPGALVLLTAAASFIQSKMVMPEPSTAKESNKKEEKQGFADALTASQGQMVYFIPLLMLFWGIKLSSGLMLFWLAGSIFGIIQQYQLGGLGGLKQWLVKLRPAR